MSRNKIPFSFEKTYVGAFFRRLMGTDMKTPGKRDKERLHVQEDLDKVGGNLHDWHL
jgi:hypothetical protein